MFEILRHSKSWSRIGVQHYAAVATDMDLSSVKSQYDLVALVSEKVGYHPCGYGMYSVTVEHRNGNMYDLEWESGRTCD